MDHRVMADEDKGTTCFVIVVVVVSLIVVMIFHITCRALDEIAKVGCGDHCGPTGHSPKGEGSRRAKAKRRTVHKGKQDSKHKAWRYS